MKLLSKLFRPRAVSDVLFSLDHLDSTALRGSACYDEIRAQAHQAVVTNPEAIKTKIVIESQKPLHVALNLIINLCGRDLSSGSDHIYRGKLSARGLAKRSLFDQAQDMLVEQGYISKEDAEHGRALVAEQIREAG